MQAKSISPGAKLVYGRLACYAGEDGECYPAVPTLADQLGISVRQTKYYLSELERKKLIRREARVYKGGQTSTTYQFLWHRPLEAGMKKTAPDGCKMLHRRGCRILHPKRVIWKRVTTAT